MTNQVETVSNTVTQETFNSIFLQMLTGVKEASTEIYSASKDMISNAVSFSMEQAPQVVNEFIRWIIVSNCVKVAIFSVIFGIALYLNKRFFNYCKRHDDDTWVCYAMWATICLVTFGMWFFNNILPSILEATKALIAPRIFLIEWTLNKINTIRY